MRRQRIKHTLNTLLNPKSVAVIGASNSPHKVGYAILKNLVNFGFRGEIIPINNHEKIVQGKKAYLSIKKARRGINLAVIAVPAAAVKEVLKECAEHGVKNAVIISAGFSEIGTSGKKLEEEIKKIVHASRMTVVGPNTLGVINTKSKLNASFSSDSPKKGHLAVISQSGALCAAILDWAKLENIGFSKFISTGNKTFIDEAHYFDYLEKDENTKAVLVYMESVHKPQHFLRHAARLAKKKPVVILKAGRYSAGQKAAFSHTGAMSIDDAVFNIACRKANIIRAKSLERFFDLAKLLAKMINPQGFKLGVITNAGGPGVITADAAEANHFKLPEFSQKTIKMMQKINSRASNPLDLIGDAKPADYQTALNALKLDLQIDIIYALLTPQSMTDPKEVAKIMVEMNKKKQVICSFLGGSAVEKPIKYMKENNIAVFETPERGIKALSQLNEYYERKNDVRIFSVPLMKRRRISRKMGGRKVLPLKEALALLQSEGIRTPKTHYFTNTAGITKLKINFPVAIKAASGKAHKTDMGLVKTNIITQKELQETAQEIIAKLSALEQKPVIAIQEMIQGQEVMISAVKTDFGTMITYGTGGIFVEVMRDFSQKIAPLTEKDIEEMLNEVKGTALLKGIRTKNKYNINALKGLIKAIAKIALAYPEIKELEINPAIINEKSAYAIDAIVKLND